MFLTRASDLLACIIVCVEMTACSTVQSRRAPKGKNAAVSFDVPFEERKSDQLSQFTDADIHSGNGRFTRATLTPYVANDREKVTLRLVYRDAELGGNKTLLGFDRTLRVYEAPQGWSISRVSVAPFPANGKYLTYLTDRKAHGWKLFAYESGYMRDLYFCVDTKEEDDRPHAGVKGRIIGTVELVQNR